MDTNLWAPEQLEFVHMGAPPNYAAEGLDSSWERPAENPADDGCPGAWDRCAFIQSLLPYRRALDSNGNRIDTHAYRDVTDPFIKACLHLLELEEMSAESHRLKVVYG